MKRAKPVATPGGDLGSSARVDATRDPWVGQLIKARYQVSSRLAVRPSGDLYAAQDLEAGAKVTIKLLSRDILLDDDLLRRLREELSITRAVARIRPNVAIVHDCDRAADGRTFIVMESLDGRSLADWIGQEGPLPVERALRVAFQIADGLQAAHNLVLGHGALTAEHVLVGAEDTVKLTGFEVARLGGAGLGRAPRDPASWVDVEGEQTSEHAGGLAERADVQALGLLLIDMLTGAVRARSEGSGAHSERKLGREVPAPVRELVTQTLDPSPQPEARDMSSLTTTLRVELDRLTERPDSWVRGPARTVRVRWRTVGMGSLIVAIMALGTWVTRHHLMALPTLPPVTQAAPTPKSPPEPAPPVPEPAPVDRSAEVLVMPRLPPPLPQTESVPPKEPVVKSTPPLTDQTAPATPGATPPVPAPPATKTSQGATPERAQAASRAPVTRPPASSAVRTATPTTAEGARATPRVPVRPAPEGGPSRQDLRPERDAPDPSAIIDWLLNEYPRQQR